MSLTYNTALFKSISFNKNDFIGSNYLFEKFIDVENKKFNINLHKSLDQVFSNKKFGENLLEPLYNIPVKSAEIQNFYQIPGYSFTINCWLQHIAVYQLNQLDF